MTSEKGAAVDEITSLFHALDDPDLLAARAVLTSEVYIDYTSMWSGNPPVSNADHEHIRRPFGP